MKITDGSDDLSSVSLGKGDKFRLTCTARGYKNSNLIWFRDRDNGTLPPLFRVKELKISKNEKAIHSSMEVKGFNHSDKGRYECRVVGNGGGDAASVDLNYSFPGKQIT